MFEQITEKLLVPAELTFSVLETELAKLYARAINFGDIYLQQTMSESWQFDEGILKDASYSTGSGVGVRALKNETMGFAYADHLSLQGIQSSLQAAQEIVAQGQSKTIALTPLALATKPLYTIQNPLESIAQLQKVDLLKRLSAYGHSLDPRVKHIMLSLSASHTHVLVLATDGTVAGDIRPMVKFSVTVIVESNGRREHGVSGGGGRRDYTAFIESDEAFSYVRAAVQQATINLEAIDTPAGMMPVLLGPGWPGVLLHEAVGHGLEGDFNRKGISKYSNRMGEQVASPLCTIVDDGTISNFRGSLNVDDEGVPTQCTTLIEKGILKGYMQDKFNARLMGMQSTGNGRRESYSSPVLPRMTNTYMLPGQHDPAEMLASISRGIYAVNFNGGQVDITNGRFVFVANEAYLVENGKIVAPVKGATLIGDGPTTMERVTMVGNDLAFDTGIGTCGKEGQSIAVGIGQPSVLIRELTVGGTSTS